MSKAHVKITAMLSNPDGIWQDEILVEFKNPETLATAHRQIVGTFQRDGGIWRTISETEHEFIPFLRIRSVAINVNELRISEDTNVAGAAAEAAAHKGIHIVG